MPEHYDVFISHSPADEEWVDDWLVPRLTAAGVSVVTERNLVVGAFQVTDSERLIAESRHVIVILTPEYLQSRWDTFESVLAQTMDVDARRRKLLPVVLRPCDPPVALKARVAARMVDAQRQEREFRRLAQAIGDTAPVPLPLRDGQARDWSAWRRWLRRYRRGVRWGVAGAITLWLALALLLQWPPFQIDPGWQNLHAPGRDLSRVFRAGDVLLVSSQTESDQCADSGLWRSVDGGTTWQTVAPPLTFYTAGGACWRAGLTDFAWTPALPERVWGATTNVGLLLSDDLGQHWQRIGEEVLPASLYRVAASPTDPALVFASGKGDGLFRSGDGGLSWQRLDRSAFCPAAGADLGALPDGFRVGALLVSGERVFAGWESPGLDSDPPSTAGLYMSEDGGNCWRRVHDAETRYDYLALAQSPEGRDAILVLVSDHRAASGGAAFSQLWVLTLAGQRIGLWDTPHAVTSVFVQAASRATWYVADWVNGVSYGNLADGGSEDHLGAIWRCRLPIPPGCQADLTGDPAGNAPLLLMGDRVYRWTSVSWWERLWP